MKIWATLNEPWVSAIIGYGTGEHAPGIKLIKDGVYQGIFFTYVIEIIISEDVKINYFSNNCIHWHFNALNELVK